MVSFDWSCDQNIGENNVTSVRISYKESAASTWTDVDVSATGTNGSVSQIVGNGNFSVDDAYNFKIEVIDSMDGIGSATGSIAGARFPIDILAQGKGVAIGKPAEKEAFEVALTQYDKFDTLVGNGLAAYGGGGDEGIDPDTTLEGLCLTSHTNAPKGLGTFFYIHTLFYNTKSVTAARTQIAYPYNKADSLYYRYYKSDAWSSWEAIGGGDFAPAGCGLGTTTSKTVTSVAALNDLTAGGWYYFALSGTTFNNVTFNYASVFVCPTSAKTSCFQELRPLATNYVLRRYLHAGTWSDWEIDNPPLMPGLEYKTSERWHGAAIYRKLIYYGISSQTGSTSGNTDITVAHGISNMEHLIRASAMRNRYTSTAKGYTLPYHSSSGGSIAITHNDATNIYIRFYKDYLGGGTIYIDLAYTKA